MLHGRTAALLSLIASATAFAGPPAGAPGKEPVADPSSRFTPELVLFPELPFMKVMLGGPGSEGGVADCPQQIKTWSSLNFEGQNQQVIIEQGMTEGEMAAASFVVAASEFPLRIDLAEILWASTAPVQTTTKWSVLFYSGTPSTGTLVATFSSDGKIIPHVVMPPGSVQNPAGLLLQFGIDPGDPDQIYISDNGSHVVSVAFRIDDHNNGPANPCGTIPTTSNAFPTVDANGVASNPNNWLYAINCPLACPAGWFNFQTILSLCKPSGDWNIRLTWTGLGCGGPAVGACCVGTNCSLLTQAECQSAGGTWQGAGTTCQGTVCQPTGNVPCCFVSTGGCVNLSYANCVAAGGIPGPVGQTCAGYTCFPSGACCKLDGTCSVMSPEDCAQINGTYQGNGTTCGGVNCPPPQGASCFPNGFCLVLAEADAVAAGATWKGAGTTCADINGNGTADICEAIQGDINGDGHVNGADIGLLIGAWGTSNAAADVNHDGTVNGADLGLLVGHWTG